MVTTLPPLTFRPPPLTSHSFAMLVQKAFRGHSPTKEPLEQAPMNKKLPRPMKCSHQENIPFLSQKRQTDLPIRF